MRGKKDLNRRQMMERAADRESLKMTRMRAERLARLAALEAGHDAEVRPCIIQVIFHVNDHKLLRKHGNNDRIV
jgi:hypothetical protein